MTAIDLEKTVLPPTKPGRLFLYVLLLAGPSSAAPTQADLLRQLANPRHMRLHFTGCDAIAHFGFVRISDPGVNPSAGQRFADEIARHIKASQS